MMGRYVIIVPITKTYLHEGRVLLKSLAVHNGHIPVHVITTDLEADVFSQYENVNRVIIEPPCDTEFRQIRTSRFRHAVDIKSDYDVVCLLDADMCSVRKLDNIFRMAESGTILACSNNTLLRYVKKDFDLMKVKVDPDIDVVHPTVSTVPVFINPSIHEDFLMEIWKNETGNDLDIPNLLMESMGIMDKVFLLNSYAWTNIHHTMLKPEIFIRKTESEEYYSNQGEPVYMLHGHWLDDNYVKHLMDPMKKNYGYYKKHLECAENCIRTIKNEYSKYKD